MTVLAEPTEQSLSNGVEQKLLKGQAADILNSDVSQLKRWNIRHIDGITNFITADVPLDQLDVEGVPTEPDNVKLLVEEFDKEAELVQGSGQRDPVVVCHVPDEGFYVTDGFHRHAAQTVRRDRDGKKRSLKSYRESLQATVQPNKTYDDVVAQRIDYARNHRGVRFARIVEWMQSDWERSEWAETVPSLLTALRSLSEDYWHEASDEEIAQIESLTDEMQSGIEEWILGRCETWRYTPSGIQEELKRADGFNPDLIKYIFVKKGPTPKGSISLGHLELLATEFSEEYEKDQELVHLVQFELVQTIREHQLTVMQTKSLIQEVEATLFDIKGLQKALQAVDIDKIKSIKPAPSGGSSSRGSARSSTSSSEQSSSNSPALASDYDILLQVTDRASKLQRKGEAGALDSADVRMAVVALEGLAGVAAGMIKSERLPRDLQARVGIITQQLMKTLGIDRPVHTNGGAPASPEKVAHAVRSLASSFLSGIGGRNLPPQLKAQHAEILTAMLAEPQPGWSQARIRQLEAAIPNLPD